MCVLFRFDPGDGEEQSAHLVRVAPAGGVGEQVEVRLEPRRWRGDGDQPGDGGVLGRQDLLLRLSQVLPQLFTWSDAHDFDRDVHIDPGTRQLDHPSGEIDDGDRLAHVEHEDVPALREQRRLEYQLHRLFDAHEEPGHPGVGHRHRPTGQDLTGERGDDAAPATEDVPEP